MKNSNPNTRAMQQMEPTCPPVGGFLGGDRLCLHLLQHLRVAVPVLLHLSFERLALGLRLGKGAQELRALRLKWAVHDVTHTFAGRKHG